MNLSGKIHYLLALIFVTIIPIQGKIENMPLVVYILGLAIFPLSTAELIVAGMITTLSEAFGVTVGEVGHLISYYALGVVLGGPVLTCTLLKFKAPYHSTLL